MVNIENPALSCCKNFPKVKILLNLDSWCWANLVFLILHMVEIENPALFLCKNSLKVKISSNLDSWCWSLGEERHILIHFMIPTINLFSYIVWQDFSSRIFDSRHINFLEFCIWLGYLIEILNSEVPFSKAKRQNFRNFEVSNPGGGLIICYKFWNFCTRAWAEFRIQDS